MAIQEFDSTEHQKIWEGFLTFTKWGVISVSVVLILMAAFLID